MKKIAIAIGLLVFLFCISVASASASETSDKSIQISAKDSGVKIVPAKSDGGSGGTKTVNSNITQGETNWHSKYITTNITSFDIDLNWGDTDDSLRLHIYDPSFNCYGPYYDSSDGTIDGRIHLTVIDLDGIEQVTWRARVYGYSVTGTEDYSI